MSRVYPALARRQLGLAPVSLRGQRFYHPVKITIQASEREVARHPRFGWTGEAVAQEVSIHDKNFCPGVLWPSVPLWQLEVPKIDLEVLGIKSDNPESSLVHEFQCHIRERHQEHILMFTDGSKDPETGATGAAFGVQGWNVQDFKRTANFQSVFTVELYAILMAVQWTEQIQNHKVLVCSDSAVNSIGKGSPKSQQDLVYDILLAVRDVKRRRVEISSVWVPENMSTVRLI